MTVQQSHHEMVIGGGGGGDDDDNDGHRHHHLIHLISGDEEFSYVPFNQSRRRGAEKVFTCASPFFDRCLSIGQHESAPCTS